jgi:uncharacterized membrane protein
MRLSHIDLLAAIAVTALAALAAAVAAPLAIRVPAGLLAVLLAPGYTTVAAIFPRRGDLDPVARMGLSVTASVMVVAGLAPLLSHSRWGLRFAPVAVAVTLSVCLAAGVAGWRRRRVAADEWSWTLRAPAPRRSWAASAIAAALLVVVGVALTAVGLYRTLHAPGRGFTEFYALGVEEFAEYYPRSDGGPGPWRLTVGIANRERQVVTYRVVVASAGRRVRTLGPVRLAEGERWQHVLAFERTPRGESRPVALTLFREGDDEPYRWLRIWPDARPATDDRRGRGAE